MSQAVSPFADRRYGLDRVCRVWGLPRSTYFHRRARLRQADRTIEKPPKRRGPRGALSDDELLQKIEEALEQSPWLGEGHRKVWARLRHDGIRTSKRRVLRVMREASLLAPTRRGRARGPRSHDGTITPERPDVMWGTDATSTMTAEGNATIFVLIDHCTAECLGIHAARRGTRFEALEPLRQGIPHTLGEYAEKVAVGLVLRHDHGSQFVSDVFQDELDFLGIESSPSFVRQPEGNGCAERFIRTLKEQLLWLQRFRTVAELNEALQRFKDLYNREWLIERHGHVSPAERRTQLLASKAAA